jgi:hypothetical protein
MRGLLTACVLALSGVPALADEPPWVWETGTAWSTYSTFTMGCSTAVDDIDRCHYAVIWYHTD